MTKSKLNTKKLKKEITKLLDCYKHEIVKYPESVAFYPTTSEDLEPFVDLFKQLIKQIVESVPMGERKPYKEVDVGTGEKKLKLFEPDDFGYNTKTKEIKQWKEEILKQLK